MGEESFLSWLTFTFGAPLAPLGDGHLWGMGTFGVGTFGGHHLFHLCGAPLGHLWGHHMFFVGHLWGHHMFFGGGCEQDWKFLCWGGIETSCIGHAKE